MDQKQGSQAPERAANTLDSEQRNRGFCVPGMEGVKTIINLVRRCPFRGSTSCMNGRTKPRERVEYTERAKRWLGSEEADSKKDHSNRSFTVPLV